MADENTPRPYSRAAFERTVALQSETAQRMLEREFDRIAAALYHLEVVQRIVSPEDEVELREEEARSLILSIQTATQNERARLLKLRSDNGVHGEPIYSHPGEFKVMITSPLAYDYLGVIQTLDQLIFLLDGLWLMGVFNNKQRANAVFQWQRTIVKLGRRLIGRQRRRVNISDTADTEDGDGNEGKKLEKSQDIHGVADLTCENDESSLNLSKPLENDLVIEPGAKVLAA